MIKNTLKNKIKSLKLTTLGFTLIELLAVIVILAIIALIATPVILGIINNVKDEANKRSIENYIDAVEQAIVRKNLTEEFNPLTCIITSEGLDCDGYNEKLKIEIDGDRPTGGTIYFEKGSVKEDSYLIKGNKISILNEDNKITTETIPKPESFASDSWRTIALNVKAGNISVYEANLKENTNNTKQITLTSDDTNIAGTYTVRIANTSTPEECDTSGFSQTACGFVVEFEDIITEHNMNSGATNVGGYPASSMYTYLQNDIYESLPDDLKDVIINTKVVSSHAPSDTSNFTTTDKLYLLSLKEVWGSNPGGYDTSADQTRQLDYYKNKGVTSNNYSGAIKKYNGSSYSWWLRSAYSSYAYVFCIVGSSGDWSNYSADHTLGVAVAFRIG